MLKTRNKIGEVLFRTPPFFVTRTGVLVSSLIRMSIWSSST